MNGIYMYYFVVNVPLVQCLSFVVWQGGGPVMSGNSLDYTKRRHQNRGLDQLGSGIFLSYISQKS